MTANIYQFPSEAAEGSSRPPACGSQLSRFSAACLEKFHRLKESVTERLASEFSEVLSLESIRHAVNEAEALVASVPFPALFLPVLAEEKVILASRWQAKQQSIRGRPLALAA